MLVLKKKKLNQKINYDPLFYLYQMDDDNNLPLNEEVIVLIKKLLYNVEEFYHLKDMINEIMNKDDKTNNVNEFFENLLKEVRSEELVHKLHPNARSSNRDNRNG